MLQNVDRSLHAVGMYEVGADYGSRSLESVFAENFGFFRLSFGGNSVKKF